MSDLTSNPRALIENLVGYVKETTDHPGFVKALQAIELALSPAAKFDDLKKQCQCLWRTDATLVCRLPKGHEGDHREGAFTWNGEVDTRAAHEPEARHTLDCDMVKHPNCTRCNCGSSIDTESHSGRPRPGEKSACLPADDRGIGEARSSESGNDGIKTPDVSIQSREPVGSNSTSGGAGEHGALDTRSALTPPHSLPAEPPSDAARDVLAERERQKSVEGWTPEHDDEHNDEQLALAAACYALGSPTFWPWENRWWKPKDRRRNLVRAGALILAEIERIDRQASTKDAGECGACDKPGEHCANVHGICSRHGGRAHETSAVHKAHDPTCGVFAGMACDCGWLDEHR